MKLKKSHLITFLSCWLAVSVGMYFLTEQSLTKQSTNEDYKNYITTEISSTDLSSTKESEESEDMAVEVLRHIDASILHDYLLNKLLRKEK